MTVQPTPCSMCTSSVAAFIYMSTLRVFNRTVVTCVCVCVCVCVCGCVCVCVCVCVHVGMYKESSYNFYDEDINCSYLQFNKLAMIYSLLNNSITMVRLLICAISRLIGIHSGLDPAGCSRLSHLAASRE